MTKFTEEPTLTDVLAAGFSLITKPEATVELDWVVTVPTIKPPPVMAVPAAACVSPTTLGTDTGAGPLETTRLTEEPVLTDVVAAGFSLITLPEATVELDWVVTVPTVKPAPVMAVPAAACASPTTLGTVTVAGGVVLALVSEKLSVVNEPTLLIRWKIVTFFSPLGMVSVAVTCFQVALAAAVAISW
jgi:hypothetical protein